MVQSSEASYCHKTEHSNLNESLCKGPNLVPTWGKRESSSQVSAIWNLVKYNSPKNVEIKNKWVINSPEQGHGNPVFEGCNATEFSDHLSADMLWFLPGRKENAAGLWPWNTRSQQQCVRGGSCGCHLVIPQWKLDVCSLVVVVVVFVICFCTVRWHHCSDEWFHRT